MPPAVAAQLLSAISMTGAQMSPQKAQQLKSQQQQHQNSHHHQSHPQSSRHHDGLAQDSQAQNGNHARRDTELPFGYNYDLGHDEDILNEPPPAPDGDMSLLTDEDAKLLSSFFETIETDTFSSSWGEGLAIPSDWQQFDDPAAALDSQSILGNFQQPQQQQQQYGISFNAADSSLSNNMPYSDTPSKQNHHQNSSSQSQSHMFYPATTTHNGLEVPREIYEAAATLVQDTRSMQQPHSRRSYHYSRTSNTSQDSAYPPSPSQPPQHHLHSQSISGPLYSQDIALTAAGMAQRASISRRNLSMSFEWGTDSSFNNASGYVPASDRDASTMLEKQQQAATIDRWFTVSQSGATTAAPTRAQTPQPASQQQQQQQQPTSFGIDRQSPKRAIATTATGEDTESDSEAIQPPATKRRKSMHTRDGTTPNALTSSATTSEKTTKTRAKNGSSSGPVRSSKSSSTPTDSAPVPVSGPGAPLSNTTKPRKQRTSTSTPATNNNTTGGLQSSKPPRKNLTDQQKRENHIFSEQRRRTAIKVGFEELTEMVTGIKGGGFSKSAVLNISCSWLQDLLDGNKRLEEQLRLTSSGSGIDLAKAEAES